MSEENKPQNWNDRLFKLAVIIMSLISGYTTAMGAVPLFGEVLSIALAAVLSILLVALAFRLPQAYQQGRQGTVIFGYICVAAVSIIFNFNFLYGKFAAEDLLYGELTEKRETITNLQIEAIKAKDKELGIIELGRQVQELKDKILYEEQNHPYQKGKGPRWRAAVKELEPIERDYNSKISTHKPYYDRVRTETENVLDQIGSALNSDRDLEQYRGAIQKGVVVYNEVAKFAATEAPNFQPSPLQIKYTHKDIGKLDHTLWTLFNFYQFKGRQIASIFVALLISMMIDLVILFVIVLTTNVGGNRRSNRRRTRRIARPMNNEGSRNSRNDVIFIERDEENSL